MTKPLSGQKAVVTGANSGIGRAIAIALGHAGADVVVNYRDGEDAAMEVVRNIAAAGSRAIAHRADVSQELEVEELFGRAVEQLGTVDILVNNAGLQRDAAFHELTLAQWNTVLAVNLTGQFLCARGVNSISPGAIRTPINRAAWSTKEAHDALLELIPYKRIGEPEDVGRAAVWLASDESEYVTGTSMYLDGGMTLYPEFADGG